MPALQFAMRVEGMEPLKQSEKGAYCGLTILKRRLETFLEQHFRDSGLFPSWPSAARKLLIIILA